MKKTTYKEVLEVNALVNKCVNKGLKVETVLKLVDYKDELQEKIEKYQKVFKEIMSEFDVKEENSMYNWKDHESQEEISSKVTDLVNAEVELTSGCFLEDEDLVKLTEGFNLGELSFVRKFLKK